MKTSAALVVLALLLPASLRAESLAEAAQRERDRRERNRQEGRAPVRVITQDDLSTNDDASATPAPRPTAASDREAPAPAPTPTRSAEEESWRARAKAARARIDAARQHLAETPETHPVMDANGAVWLMDNPEHAAARSALAAAETALVDLEDEARRAGVLPGWLR
jgi:hypothetical protein